MPRGVTVGTVGGVGVCVRVDVEWARVEQTVAACFSCEHRFTVSWEEFRRAGVTCPRCGSECDINFHVPNGPEMNVTYSTVRELAALVGVTVPSDALHGRLDPRVVLAASQRLAGARFGPQLLDVARAASAAGVDIVWS